ncbi:GNAT family N-acetyltransferase [Pseudodesulfovibrio sp. zrk46]|uniref:GNAT family N-acetyltransferase n=1 Tax=Pseudodesulfovibrio sp. zrk46 TaxID=2725288 RepID=UPI0014492ACB|nr:GNAT family N-acetyltransferase [Pseudodesulfovibrio sp. zrk46]QJB56564.1 GNAT family N-acetyltransferase [Pseudodesulfovibrio sp. zrk46]
MEFKLYSQYALPSHHLVWTKNAISTNQADPFCSTPAWQITFHDAFAPGRRLLIESSDNSHIAFAEHIVSPTEVYLTPIESHWCFGCPLLGKHAVEMLISFLPDIENKYATPPKILVSGIRPDGVLSQRLIQAFAPKFDIYIYNSSTQGVASLQNGLDGYLSRRSGNHRKKLKKQARRSTELGISYERVCPMSAQEAEATYSRMIQVELTSWKGIEKCGMAETPAREFYDIMLKRLSASGDGRVIFAKHEGKDIGFIFGAMAGNIYRGQQFSYDDQWKDYSIGNLMQIEKIRWLSEEGAKRYDMGPVSGPQMEYKTHWTEKHLPIQAWLLVKK